MRLADRLSLGSYRSALLPQARRLGLTSIKHLEALAVARGYTLPDRDEDGQQIFSRRMPGRQKCGTWSWPSPYSHPDWSFANVLSVRGALMLLRVSRVTESFWIAREANKERAWQVIRHVALLGLQAHPQEAHWRNLLAILPRESTLCPALPEGAMPDEAIFKVLANAWT